MFCKDLAKTRIQFARNERMRHQVEKRSDLSRSVTKCLSEPYDPGVLKHVPPRLYCLPPLDPKSEKSANSFRSFSSSNDERKTTLELSGGDAKVSIEIIDRVCSS